MKKLDSHKLLEIMRSMKFYNFDEMCTSNAEEIVVKFADKEDVVTYSDLNFDGSLNIFEQQKRIIIQFVKLFLLSSNEETCVLKKYSSRWVKDPKLTKGLYDSLHHASIRSNYSGGIVVGTNSKELEWFIESVLKYNSFIQIILIEAQIIITPTDHMDVFFESIDLASIEKAILNCNCTSTGDKNVFNIGLQEKSL